MEKKLTKIVGLKKEEFDQFISSGELQLREARLIPFFKPGDEMALTSVYIGGDNETCINNCIFSFVTAN